HAGGRAVEAEKLRYRDLIEPRLVLEHMQDAELRGGDVKFAGSLVEQRDGDLVGAPQHKARASIECVERRFCQPRIPCNRGERTDVRSPPTARRGCPPCSRRWRRAAPGPSRASSCNCPRTARGCTASAAH